LEEEKFVLGYNVSTRYIDTYWWAGRSDSIGEIIEVHKITTKKGDPMAFLQVEYRDRIESVTVFPDMWALLRDFAKVGTVGHFKANRDGILVTAAEPEDYGAFRVYVKDPEGFMSFCPSMRGDPNVYSSEGAAISRVSLDDRFLRFIDGEFGITRITVNR
jgi:hypothetical protein